MPKELTRHQLSSRIAYDQSVPSFLRKLRNQVAGVSNHESDPEPEPELEQEEQEAAEDEFGRQRRPRLRDPNENESRGGDEDREWDTWQTSSGRPSIPRRPMGPDSGGKGDNYADKSDGTGRPPIPERPEDDPGSADEDDDGEGPQVVVLKEGKHLSSVEVENEKRKAKGLPPLEDISNPDSNKASLDRTMNLKNKDKQERFPSLSTQPQSFASIGSGGAKSRSSALKRKGMASNATDSDTGANATTSMAKTNVAKKIEKSGTKKMKKQKIGLLSFGDDG